MAKDCNQIKCFVCDSSEHVKRNCNRLKAFLDKKIKSKCFNCHQWIGHFSNECDQNWVDPLEEVIMLKVHSSGEVGGVSDVNPGPCIPESS